MQTENNFGVSLTKEACIICLKEIDGPIIMNTKLTKKEKEKIEKLNGKIIGFAKEPCDECKENIKKAFMFIGFYEDKSDMDNLPQGFYRSGHIVGTKKEIPLVQEFVKNNIPGAIEKGYCFMPVKIMKQIGLIN